MKYTGRYSAHEEVENNPEKPFLEDLKKDINKIDTYYSKRGSKEIKKKMIEFILNSL